MKYNAKYDRWVSKDGLVYRYSKTKDKLVICKTKINENNTYPRIWTKAGLIRIHRLVWETFKGSIPDVYVIDHINTIRNDNRLENLRCVTQKENINNPLSIQNHINSVKGKPQKIRSEFGIKYKEHFGYTALENRKQYDKEWKFWKHHNNKCRWEV